MKTAGSIGIPGVNPISLMRASWQNFSSGKIVSGGSTLTMQVARLLHPQKRSYSGKIRQILRALQLELHLSKDEILNLYLNYAPFGGTREGVQVASYQYLGKPVSDVTRAEAALLAVLPQAPSRLRPDRYPQKAQAARDKLLKRLLDFEVWTEEQVDDAMLEQVSVYNPRPPMLAPLLARRLAQDNPHLSRIKTHINFDQQSVLQDLANDYSHSQPDGTSVAVLVVENKTRNVKAYVGSADLNATERFGHVDMVTAVRSPGSTLKPFLYGLAIDDGLVHSASLLTDVPRTFSEYQPANFDRGFNGPVTLEFALKNSLNIPAVEVLEHYGPVRFSSKLSNVGLRLRLPRKDKPNLSVILGGTGVTLEELVRTYMAFSNKGQVAPLNYLFDVQSSKAGLNSRYLMTEESAWIIQRILQEVPRTDRINSNAVMQELNQIAWKSGTSYGYRDAWSIGLNADYTIGVWVGRPDGTPLPGHFGSLSAAPLMFSSFELLDSKGSKTISQPKSVERLPICWPLGTEKNGLEMAHCHVEHEAWIANDVIPATLPQLTESSDWIQNPAKFWVNDKSGLLVDASCQVDSRRQVTRALWPKNLEPWIASKLRRARLVPDSDPGCDIPVQPNLGEIRITGLSQHAVLRSAGESNVAPKISISLIGARGKRGWYINGQPIKTTNRANHLEWPVEQPGYYQVVAIDETGNSAKVDFRVIE